MRKPWIRPVLGAVVFLAAAILPAQAQVKAAVGKPDAEYREGFTRINGIRELPNGKVLVVDPSDKVVQLVDLEAGSSVKVGREGGGPGEYRTPGTLLGLPTGETLLHDLASRHFLTTGPDAKPAGFVDLPRSSGGGGANGPVLVFGPFDARGTDAQGRIYFQGTPFSGPNQPPLDSVPIMRWDRVRPAFDTLGYVKLPSGGASATASGGGVRVVMGNQKEFTPTEAWHVTGDGRVALVFPSPYRVVWLEGGGKSSAGPVQPYTPIRVTEADKALKREARKKSRPTIVAFGAGGRSLPAPNIQTSEPEFQETMPPFEGRGSVLATPEGEVWVLRTRPASDKTPSYNVFDKTGALVKRVTLNPNSRVVAFGKGTLYVARSDEDDLQYLQRYKRP